MTCKTCGWAYADAITQNKVDPTVREILAKLAEANQEIGMLLKDKDRLEFMLHPQNGALWVCDRDELDEEMRKAPEYMRPKWLT